MSLIEAMACGLPIVTTYSGAIPEIVDKSAILCQPNDFCSLYESIRSLILVPALRETWARPPVIVPWIFMTCETIPLDWPTFTKALFNHD